MSARVVLTVTSLHFSHRQTSIVTHGFVTTIGGCCLLTRLLDAAAAAAAAIADAANDAYAAAILKQAMHSKLRLVVVFTAVIYGSRRRGRRFSFFNVAVYTFG